MVSPGAAIIPHNGKWRFPVITRLSTASLLSVSLTYRLNGCCRIPTDISTPSQLSVDLFLKGTTRGLKSSVTPSLNFCASCPIETTLKTKSLYIYLNRCKGMDCVWVKV